jgi:hypothetical protein
MVLFSHKQVVYLPAYGCLIFKHNLKPRDAQGREKRSLLRRETHPVFFRGDEAFRKAQLAQPEQHLELGMSKFVVIAIARCAGNFQTRFVQCTEEIIRACNAAERVHASCRINFWLGF